MNVGGYHSSLIYNLQSTHANITFERCHCIKHSIVTPVFQMPIVVES